MRAMTMSMMLIVTSALCACGGGGGSDPSGNGGHTQINSVQTTSVTGAITDLHGNPISGVKVTAFWTNTNTEVSTTTDSRGAYGFSGLSANSPYGNYEIRAEKTGYAFYPSVVDANGSVIKSDYNALYRVVIAVPSSRAVNVSNANFMAYVAGDKLVSLPRTSQSVSYASGDDGALQSGVSWPSTRFVDNNDGTVNDKLSGLVWLKNAACFSASNWTAALASANQLANGACGLSDGSTVGQWRLPSSGELESLVDVSQSNPALSINHPFSNVGTTYWTSTTYRGVTSEAWVIRFTDGRYINDGVGNLKSTSLNLVWAVKSGITSGTVNLPATGQFIPYGTNDDGAVHKGAGLTSPRFIDKSDGTVTDTVTGLVWLKKADCIHLQWVDAIAAVNSLSSGQCGLTDGSTAGQWRLPNRTELLSLVDRAETNQALRFNTAFYNADRSVNQPAIFNNYIEFEFYWTSSTDAADTTLAWTVFSCDFGVYDIAKTNVGYTLAVR